MKKIELLAPAGSLESVYAAVQKGADAIYLGGSRFSARAYASNFNDDILEQVIDYCHVYGVKVYITVNTLIKENELNAVMEYIGFLYKIGVDALIVQDTGVANFIKTNFSDFEIHASTQMTIHNGEGALYYNNLGFKRIVLSRELNLKEIEHISKDLNIETEIFVHGALCVCYSGQCLMSSIIGGRSGNRGRCAQPCRMQYTLVNKNTGENAKGYFLSTKDINTIDIIKEIVESGAASLKIEGRMKRPEYVAGVVGSYRKAIDSLVTKKKYDIEAEKVKLLKLFNREGFSKAYFLGNKGRDMMAYNFPKNTGVELGRVLNDGTVFLLEELSLKDGVRAGEKGTTVSKLIKNGKEVSSAGRGDKVKIYPAFYKKGDIIYKTSDEKLLSTLSESYKEKFNRKIKAAMKVDFTVGKALKLIVTVDGKIYTKLSEEKVERALKKPLSREKIEENLKKTGNTPFDIEEITFENFEEGFLPVSTINLLRRDILEDIIKDITSKCKRAPKETLIRGRNLRGEVSGEIPELMVSVCTVEQYEAAVASGADNIIIDAFFKKSPSFSEYKPYENVNIYLKVPNVIKEEFNSVCALIDEALLSIKGIVTANAGIIGRYRGRVNIIGDYKLNIFNSLSLDFYKGDINGACISTELSKNEIKALNKGKTLKTQVLIFGKMEAMVSEYCPVGSVMGGKADGHKCNNACMSGEYVLKDRMGVEFEVVTDRYCRSHIYNPIPVNLMDKRTELIDIGVDSFRIDFINEKEKEVKRVLRMLKEENIKFDLNEYTRGSYKRGVE